MAGREGRWDWISAGMGHDIFVDVSDAIGELSPSV